MFCFVFRGSTETRITEVKVDPAAYLRSSQKEVLSTKPDYQRIVQDQNQVFAYVELVVRRFRLLRLITLLSRLVIFFSLVTL